MDNPFTDYYRIGGIGGIKYGREKYNHLKEIPWDIQRSICVNPAKKLIYYKPGKAAGTSIFRVLLQPMGGWIIQKDNPVAFSAWIQNVTDADLSQYFSFIFVRNPFSRLVSVWNDKKNQYKLDKDFKKFVLNENGIFDNEVPRGIHLQRQSSLIETNTGVKCNINFVGKVETINDDWETLCLCAGIPFRPMVHAQARPHEHYTSFYDTETANKVVEIYKRDFEIFGYDKKITNRK